MAITYTFSNGTLADADEVNANFSYVLVRPKIYQASIPSNLTTTDASYTTKQTIDLSANPAYSFEYQSSIFISPTSSTTSWRLHITMTDNSTADIGEISATSDGSTASGQAMMTGCYQPTGTLKVKTIEIQGKRTAGAQTGSFRADNYTTQSQAVDFGGISWIRYLAE